MPKLAPEVAAKAGCDHPDDRVVLEHSEPDVGFQGQAYCDLCGATLWLDPHPTIREPRHRRGRRARRIQ